MFIMDVQLKQSFNLNSLAAQFSICSTHLAWGENKDVALVDLCQTDSVIFLKGHHRDISALKFVQINHCWSLISASSDYVIIWHVDEVIQSHELADPIRGHILCSVSDAPHYLSSYLSLLCCVSNTGLTIIDTVSSLNNKMIASFEASCLSCAEFIDENNIVATSYKGHIHLINFNKFNISSTNVHSFNCSLVSLTADICTDQFAAGSSLASVVNFAFHDKENRFKQNMKLDLDEKLTHAHPHWKRTGSGDESRGHVIALMFIEAEPHSFEDGSGSKRCLLCATERALFAINCNTQDVHVAPYLEGEVGAPQVGKVQFAETDDRTQILCAATCLLEAKLLLFNISLFNPHSILGLSLVSSVPLSPHSPLHSEIKLSPSSYKANKDQPLTFKSKIKSSGYKTAPRMNMFKPQTNLSKRKEPKPKHRTQSKLGDIDTGVAPEDLWIGDVSCEQIKVVAEDCPISCVAVNDSSPRIACVIGSTTIVGELPLNKLMAKNRATSGHSQSVIGCFWSHDKNLLMTYARSGDVKLWNPPYTNDAVMTCQVVSDPKMRKDLIHAQFYYVDKFLLFGVGNKISLHNYQLNKQIKDDVKRYLSKSKEKVVNEWEIPAQSLTCMSAPNSFYSYTVLACGSDRTISVLDMNRSEEVYKFIDVHSRPAHTIKCAVPSTQSHSHIFMTSSQSDGIKLWDLRSQNCVHKLHHHQSSSKCSITMSSCGNYVATTSDSKAVYVYDVRKSFPLQEMHRKLKTTSLLFVSDAKQLLLGSDSSTLEVIKSI